MCEIKTVLIAAALILAATGFCKYQVNSEKKVDSIAKSKVKVLAKNGTKKFCLNGGECYYLNDGDIVGCKCTWLCGGKRCENTCGGLR